MTEVPQIDSITKSASILNSANDAFQKSSDYMKMDPEQKILMLPRFAATLSNHIMNASAFIRLLGDTEWNSPELQQKGEALKKELNQVRTRLRYILRQELTPRLTQVRQSLKARFPKAKEKHLQGDSLEYVAILEEFAHLEVAEKIATPSLVASAMKSLFNADIESSPEDVKDYLIHIDSEVLEMRIAADSLSRYRRILESGETTSERILAREDVIRLADRLLA